MSTKDAVTKKLNVMKAIFDLFALTVVVVNCIAWGARQGLRFEMAQTSQARHLEDQIQACVVEGNTDACDHLCSWQHKLPPFCNYVKKPIPGFVLDETPVWGI